MKIKLYYLTTVLLFLVGWNDSFCQKPIFFSDTPDHYLIGKSILLLEDKKNEFELETVLDSSHLFKENTIDLISLGLSSSSFWLKFNIQNNTSLPYLILVIDQPSLDFVELYTQDANHTFSSLDIGEHKKFRERKYQHPVYLFDLDLAPHESATFYLKVKGDEPIVLPISLETPQDMVKLLSNKDMVMGIYLGGNVGDDFL